MPWQNNNGGGGDKSPWGQPPRGGGGGRGGPPGPDIDDLIRQFQNSLKGLLPGGLRGPIGIIVLLLVLFVGVNLLSFRVQPGEESVVLRFGEWTRTATPGFNWRLPYPVETVQTVQVERQRRVDIGFHADEQNSRRQRQSSVRVLEESLMLTGDENIVEIAFTVFWRINDPKNFLFNIQDPQELTVRVVAESAMREVIGKTDIQFALTQGRSQIQQEAQSIIQATLDDYEAGISITEVNLARVDPPSQVIESFRDVQAAEADRDRFTNEAQAYANSIIPEARGEAERLIQGAEAYKAEVIATSAGEAARFMSVYTEYAQAKDVTRKRIYLETMEGILAGMNKIILDDKAGSGVVPYLPLPEINARRKSRSEGGSNE